MPLLPTEKIVESGLIATYTAADVGGDTFKNDGLTILHVKNDSVSPITVTVTAEQPTTEKPGFGTLSKSDAVAVIGATSDEFIGPFPGIAFGLLGAITYTDVTTLTVAVLRI